ncbi:MAG: hypothetical protein IIC71_08380 [Acidobacteria bacterium]|nr:hypothetical protein [Acidobacteriota bacterium]
MPANVVVVGGAVVVDGVAVVVGRVVVGLGLAVVVDVTVPVVDVGGNDVVEKSVSEPEHAAAISATATSVAVKRSLFMAGVLSLVVSLM